MQILHVLPDYFQEYPKACLNGWGRVFLTVAPDGAVLPFPPGTMTAPRTLRDLAEQLGATLDGDGKLGLPDFDGAECLFPRVY